MTTTTANLDDLMTSLGHEFRNITLLEAALTHSSVTKGRGKKHINADYDRLEFLGDRVLGLVIAEELFKRFATAEAGQLSRRYNAQVRREALAEIAEAMGLADHIRMADDLAASGGLENPAILEDVIEAVIAALYLDGGMMVARKFIKAHWWPRFDHEHASRKDAKSALQEWAAKLGKPPPVYEVTDESGPDHDRHFRVAVRIEGHGAAEGAGASKRVAEQKAAAKMLKEFERD
ncbi:MAG: ribonuclease III [Sneathiella sp.]|nr:ribonuclease III [Sneathiella sp.]